MNDSYKVKLTVDATGLPTALGTPEKVTVLGGLLDHTLNFDNTVVFTGPVQWLGRLVDASIGGLVEHRVKNGYFTVPFVKLGQ